MSESDKEYSWANPNETFLNGRGAWAAYVIVVCALHAALLAIPWFSTASAWTLTCCLHNILHYWLFHGVIGSPFITYDQGRSRALTCWEQLDHGAYYTASKKFLWVPPVVLFILASHYSHFAPVHFAANLSTTALALAPKLPLFYRFRLFGLHQF